MGLTSNSSASNGSQNLSAVGTAQLATGSGNSLNAGTGTLYLSGGTFQIQASASGDAIKNTSPVVVNTPATLDINGQTETIATRWAKAPALSSCRQRHADDQRLYNASTTFSGLITDNGSGGILTKIGSGTLVLSGGSDTYATTHLQAGTLEVDGSLTQTSKLSVEGNGVTLDGSGTIHGRVEVTSRRSKLSTIRGLAAMPTQFLTISNTAANGVGIQVDSSATNVTIGGATRGQQVHVSTNTTNGIGILVQATATASILGSPSAPPNYLYNNVISGNFIGLDIFGSVGTLGAASAFSYNSVTGNMVGIAVESGGVFGSYAYNTQFDQISNNTGAGPSAGIGLLVKVGAAAVGDLQFIDFSGDTFAGVDNLTSGSTGLPVEALFNWWGSATGPSGIGPGSGSAVLASQIPGSTDYFVDYAPWSLNNAFTAFFTGLFQGNLVVSVSSSSPLAYVTSTAGSNIVTLTNGSTKSYTLGGASNRVIMWGPSGNDLMEMIGPRAVEMRTPKRATTRSWGARATTS